MKVALVEDDTAVLELLSTLIRRYDRFELVAVVNNAEDALYKVGKSQPDIIITDIGLPGLSGIDFLQALKAVSSSSKVIVYSGYDDSNTVKLAFNAGAVGYIVKGGSQKELIRAISDVERGHRHLSKSLKKMNVED